jgi:hypothetical protein
MPTAEMVHQIIPKAMNSSITDSGTPNIHIIIIRLIASSSLMLRAFRGDRWVHRFARSQRLFSSFHATTLSIYNQLMFNGLRVDLHHKPEI